MGLGKWYERECVGERTRERREDEATRVGVRRCWREEAGGGERSFAGSRGVGVGVYGSGRRCCYSQVAAVVLECGERSREDGIGCDWKCGVFMRAGGVSSVVGERGVDFAGGAVRDHKRAALAREGV